MEREGETTLKTNITNEIDTNVSHYSNRLMTDSFDDSQQQNYSQYSHVPKYLSQNFSPKMTNE
jgi:hypothetical protein